MLIRQVENPQIGGIKWSEVRGSFCDMMDCKTQQAL